MQGVIRKWGNSPALRLPTALLEEAALAVDQAVRITVVRGRIVIEPSDRLEYDLDAMLAAIDADNLHAPVDAGGPVGKEAL